MDNTRNEFRVFMRSVLWAEAHRKELELSTAWHVEHGTGEKESIIEKNMEKVEVLADSTFFQAAPITLRILFTSLAVFFINWPLGLLALCTLLCYAWVGVRNEPFLKPMREEYWLEERELEKMGSELTQNWRPIKTFGLEEVFSQRNLDKLMVFWERETERHKKWRGRMIRFDNVISFSRAFLFALCGVLFVRGQITIGLIVLSLAWFERTYSNYYNLTDFQHKFHTGLESVKQLLAIYRTVPTVRQSDQPAWPGPLRGEVEFRNVSFRYPGSEKEALSGIDLRVPPNSVVALMGYTGSGKTTLASLLQREYDPTEGSILIDGVDLRDLDYLKYRQSIGVVHQQSVLFDTTIGQNIRLSRESALPGEERVAAEQAYAHEFIAQLPLEYETPIGENGVLLSGGQRQRSSIARALHRKPPILILDEATSALDPESQRRVQNAIDELIARRESTIFIIAHRFSTIMNADMVVMLNNGKIEEVGTHAELARGNGLYQKFRALEMGGALVEDHVV
jgi:ABC-type multidrug transport system fused ATPase/permease subunit